MSELDFRELSLEDYGKVYEFTSKYGEGSCQHSFITMYSLNEKYGDLICEKDGFLFILRIRLCNQDYRVYLAPLGNGDWKSAFERILADAHEHGARVKFISLTKTAAEYLEHEFSEQFEIMEDRDLAEYIYLTDKIARFPGVKLEKRRKEINKFWRTYGERAHVTTITRDDFQDILEFEQLWLEQNIEDHDMVSLKREQRSIQLQLEHYEELALSGVVLRIDGRVHGFSYGVKLSDDYYDAIIEKCDKNILNIYRVVRQESVKQCAMDCKYVNLEEDLGIEGLRNLKHHYKPEFLLEKFIVTEKQKREEKYE